MSQGMVVKIRLLHDHRVLLHYINRRHCSTGVSRGHLAIIAILRNDVGGRGSALATGLCMHGNHYEYSPYCGMQTE